MPIARVRRNFRHISRSAGEIDINASRILFRRILETKFATDLLNTGFDLLDVVGRVVAFADDAEPS